MGNDAEVGHDSDVATDRHLVTRRRFRIALQTVIAIVIGVASSLRAFEIDRWIFGVENRSPVADTGSGVVGFAAALPWRRRERALTAEELAAADHDLHPGAVGRY